MKKIIVVLIILVYGLSSTGAIVHLDYCCGRLENISLSSSQMEDCKDVAIKAKGCCDSKQVHLKVKGEQEVSVKWASDQKLSISSINIVQGQHEIAIAYKPISEFSNGPPLPHSSVPLFIQHCLFRI